MYLIWLLSFWFVNLAQGEPSSVSYVLQSKELHQKSRCADGSRIQDFFAQLPLWKNVVRTFRIDTQPDSADCAHAIQQRLGELGFKSRIQPSKKFGVTLTGVLAEVRADSKAARVAQQNGPQTLPSQALAAAAASPAPAAAAASPSPSPAAHSWWVGIHPTYVIASGTGYRSGSGLIASRFVFDYHASEQLDFGGQLMSPLASFGQIPGFSTWEIHADYRIPRENERVKLSVTGGILYFSQDITSASVAANASSALADVTSLELGVRGRYQFKSNLELNAAIYLIPILPFSANSLSFSQSIQLSSQYCWSTVCAGADASFMRLQVNYTDAALGNPATTLFLLGGFVKFPI